LVADFLDAADRAEPNVVIRTPTEEIIAILAIRHLLDNAYTGP